MKNTSKQTTSTMLVLEELYAADDFLSAKQLVKKTQRNRNQVFAALHHLRNHKAVESIKSNGNLYWFATKADNRLRVVEEMAQETKPRKPRPPRRKTQSAKKDPT